MEKLIKDIYYESCCGTWCVFLKVAIGQEIRIARIDMRSKNSEKKAQKYVQELKTFFKIK